MNKNTRTMLLGVLSVMVIGILDFDKTIETKSHSIFQAIPILNFVIAQEDEEEDDTENESTEDDAEEESGPPTGEASNLQPEIQSTTSNIGTTVSPNSTTFTVSRILEGNISMMQSQLPLIKKMIVGDITDVVALQSNTNSTVTASAQVINEIAGLTQSIARVDTIKSIVSDELDSAISIMASNVNNNGEINGRILIDNQVECSPTSLTNTSNTSNESICQFTINIHE